MRRASRAARGPLLRRTLGGGDPKAATAIADDGIAAIWEAPRVRSRPPSAWIGRRDALVRRGLAAADVMGAYLGLLIAVNVHLGQGHPGLQPIDLLIAPFVVIAAKAIGLYDRDQHVLRMTTIDEIPSITFLSLLYALSVWLAEGVLFSGAVSRPQVFILGLASFALIGLGRAFMRSAITRLAPAERCLIVGNPNDTARVADKLLSAGVSAQIVGRIGPETLYVDQGRFPQGRHRMTNLDALVSMIESHQAERVIIAPDSHDQDEILNVIRLVKALGVKVSVLPRLLEVVGSSSTFDDIQGLTLLGVRQYGITKSSALLKRVMDVIVASVVLALLAPLLGMIAAAIKLDSSGPVFFRQRRIGRSGEFFEMLKFRSMVKEADQFKKDLLHRNEAQGGLFKITEDPRITRVGRFLRRTSLDELPQLLNVLAGSMSLVGPRPLVPDEDALLEGWKRRRLAVKPGMTGMWQIYGSSRIPMDEMVKIDYMYGASWSLWLDLKILCRTLPYVLGRRGR